MPILCVIRHVWNQQFSRLIFPRGKISTSVESFIPSCLCVTAKHFERVHLNEQIAGLARKGIHCSTVHLHEMNLSYFGKRDRQNFLLEKMSKFIASISINEKLRFLRDFVLT